MMKRSKSKEFAAKRSGRRYGLIKTRRAVLFGIKFRRITSALLCLCLAASLLCNFGGLMLAKAVAPEATESAMNRIADYDTTDSYIGKLLSSEWGSRYAGRVWTDKSVFAFGNNIGLDMDTDGYDGTVKFNSDFGTIFSALSSSQVVNEYPPSPIDLVIVFDMSASMGQDTRYGLDGGTNGFTTHNASGDSQTWPAEGVLMSDRIEHSRIQLTLNAINNTIDKLMAQNPENRVAVCCYGANAVVLLPLAHYTRQTGTTGEKLPYLKVGGMETLYHPGDLVWRDAGDSVGSVKVAESGWYWINNRDTAYTVEAHAMKNDDVSPYSMEKLLKPEVYLAYDKIISNNVKNTGVKAFPGVEYPAQINDASPKIKENSKLINQNGTTSYAARSDELIAAVAETKELKANDYVGYFTNTQGGIYLAYKQLADSKATTYTDRLSDGKDNTVARIPAAIIMSDGGANFAFNNMSGTVDDWNKRYGAKHNSANKPTDLSYYLTDDSYNDDEDGVSYTIRDEDYKHRLGGNENENPGNIGDEWYNVYLPGDDTLAQGEAGITTKDGKWDGLHTLYNLGADYYEDGTLQTQPVWDRPGVLYANDADWQGTPATILEVLLTASYMKQVATKHYETGWEEGKASPDSKSSLSTYTMNVDTKNLPQWARWRLFPTLDPKNYPPNILNTLVENEPGKFAEPYGVENWDSGAASSYRGLVFDAIVREWKALKDRHVTNPYVPLEGGASAAGGVAAKLDLTAQSKYIYGGKIEVSADEILDSIAYNDEFTDVASGELDTTFERILSEITGSVFIPISGDNDAGVGDSITYQDPLGEYMELKNGAITVEQAKDEEDNLIGGEVTGSDEKTFDMSMLLFGEMHGLVRAGVYDYQWNNDYMRNNGTKEGYPANVGKDPDKDPLPIGWYKGDALNAVYSYNNNGLPDGCDTAADAWANGWVLRLNYKTLAEFVPISGITDTMLPTEVPEQIQNTVYTCYRFADNQADRNRLRRNPIFGEEIPQDLVEKWNAYYDVNGSYPVGMDFYSGYSGVYRLSDIRVWTEHTGDFVDQTGAITPEEESGYDDSLYVNIPISAVPTQLAEITLGPDGPIAYKDNLAIKNQSTPFRLFYAVGLTEDLIMRDSNDKQTGVDVAKISGEYIASHSDPNTGNIYFVSNWYSNTAYRGYASDESIYGYSTRGDAAVTFSPDEDNRYYLFQKPLPLIAHAYRVTNADGDVVSVDNAENKAWEANGAGNGKTTWEDGSTGGASWSGGEFIGTYNDNTAFKEALSHTENIGGVQYITDAKGYKYPLPEKLTDAIITYTKDQLSRVDSDSDGYTEDSVSFSSDDYFFLCIEYYLPIGGTTGKDIDGNEVPGTQAARKVNRLIARKGSAFGSGLHSENIDNGDMLCWTDINGKCTLELEYNSRTDTGDVTRGRPTLEKLTLTGEDLIEYLRDTCNLNVEPIADGQSYLDLDYAYWTGVQQDTKMKTLIEQITELPPEQQQAKFDELFDWSVAARTGGIRVGDMFNNVQAKGGNTTPAEGSTEYYVGNLTRTANNYYVPTLSETSTAGDGLIINNYLGNNGRLEVANATLMVTKTLVAPDGFTLTQKQENETFDYQVYVQGLTGERLAQRLKWNPFSQSWQKRIETLDILTDNSSLLVDTSGNQALFCYESGVPRQIVEVYEDGAPRYYYADATGAATETQCTYSTSEFYYLYLPGSADNLNYHLFASTYEGGTTDLDGVGTTAYYPAGMDTSKLPAGDNTNQKFAEAVTGKDDSLANRPAGSREYWTNQAVLIPFDEVAEQDADAWVYNAERASAYKKVSEPFTLVTVIPDPEGTDSTVYSPYRSRTQYMTTSLYFGYTAELAKHLEAEGETFAGCTHADSDYKLSKDGLYDKIIPSADRPDLFGNSSGELTLANGEKLKIDNDYIAAHTAEFTLKHGEGLMLTGLGNRITYRFTEKLSDAQIKQGYLLKEISHIQQRGSDTVYMPGVQNIVVDGKLEPFAHTNATIWESYATMAAGALGNHHQPLASGEVAQNPNCHDAESETELAVGKCDLLQTDGSTRHYFYYGGKLVDPHYQGEQAGMSRYVLNPTAHFGVANENVTSDPTNPESGYYDYTGVYSTYGNTGYFSEQANYTNTFAPDVLIVSKALVGVNGTPLNDADRQNDFTFGVSFLLPAESDAPARYLTSPVRYWTGKTSELNGAPMPNTEAVKDLPTLTVDSNLQTYTFKLKADESIVFYSLPIDAKYTVTEQEHPNYPIEEGKTYSAESLIKHTKFDGGWANTTPNKVLFTNTKPAGILTVEKLIENTIPEPEKGFKFTIKLIPKTAEGFSVDNLVVERFAPDGTTSTEKLVWNDVGGAWTAECTLRNNEKISISRIPVGAEYTVSEAYDDDYRLQRAEDGSGNIIPTDSSSPVRFDRDTLSVTGTVPENDNNVYLRFINALPVIPPFTGGHGWTAMYILGALLLTVPLAAAIVLRRGRRSM